MVGVLWKRVYCADFVRPFNVLSSDFLLVSHMVEVSTLSIWSAACVYYCVI